MKYTLIFTLKLYLQQYFAKCALPHCYTLMIVFSANIVVHPVLNRALAALLRIKSTEINPVKRRKIRSAVVKTNITVAVPAQSRTRIDTAQVQTNISRTVVRARIRIGIVQTKKTDIGKRIELRKSLRRTKKK